MLTESSISTSGIAFEEHGQDRRDEEVRRVGRHAQANATHGGVPEPVEDVDGPSDVVERHRDGVPQRLARARQGDAPAGAVEKAHAEAFLQSPERVAQRRGTDAEVRGRATEVAVLGDFQEVRKVGEVRSTKLHPFSPSRIAADTRRGTEPLSPAAYHHPRRTDPWMTVSIRRQDQR